MTTPAMTHGIKKIASNGPRKLAFTVDNATANSVPRPSEPTTVPNVKTAVASTTMRNGGSVEPATDPKFLSPTRGGLLMSARVAPVREYSSAPAYGTSTRPTSGTSAGTSNSHATQRSKSGEERGTAARSDATARVPPSALL